MYCTFLSYCVWFAYFWVASNPGLFFFFCMWPGYKASYFLHAYFMHFKMCLSHQTFVSTGTNLTLQFCPSGLSDDKPSSARPSSESVDYTTDPNRVRRRVYHCCSVGRLTALLDTWQHSYSGKLSREKTFVNFKVLWLFVKVFFHGI